MTERSTFFFICQVYVPDPAAVGQHVASAAVELARRGHRVIVITSSRGYEDPGVAYPAREMRDGVEIRRVGFASFGKRFLPIRALSGLLFVSQSIVHGLTIRNLRTVVITTVPPMSAIAGLAIGLRARVKLKYWIMDLNPDQAVAMGFVKRDSMFTRAMDWLNRKILLRADSVVVLDRFMQSRILEKVPSVAPRVRVIPPWPLEQVSAPLDHANNEFRIRHGLNGKFVVMYSGNHSLINPLTTLLAAAERFRDDPNVVFLFVGGGQGKKEVESSTAPGIVSLPYQPLEALRESLSAADVHVVTLGENMVGIVHPCKVYGAMAVGRPVLLFSPAENHVTDMLATVPFGRRVAHGDVEGAAAAIRELLAASAPALAEMGERGRHMIVERFSRESLLRELCDTLEAP